MTNDININNISESMNGKEDGIVKNESDNDVKHVSNTSSGDTTNINNKKQQRLEKLRISQEHTMAQIEESMKKLKVKSSNIVLNKSVLRKSINSVGSAVFGRNNKKEKVDSDSLKFIESINKGIVEKQHEDATKKETDRKELIESTCKGIIEEQQHNALRREAEEKCLDAIQEHLIDYLAEKKSGSSNNDFTYEDWISELHPDNVKNNNTKKTISNNEKPTQKSRIIEIDHRFYVEDSHHRHMWNNLVSEEKKFIPSQN